MFFFNLLNKVVEDGYEFFAKRQLVTLFSAPNYCGEFDNAGGMMTVDESLLCSFQVSTLNITTFVIYKVEFLIFFFSSDSETIREKGEISIQFNKQQHESD